MGGALEARQIPAGDGYLSSDATGEIELDGKVMVIKRIHVDYHLKLDPKMVSAAERAHELHADYCPVAKTIQGCVEITTSLHTENL